MSVFPGDEKDKKDDNDSSDFSKKYWEPPQPRDNTRKDESVERDSLEPPPEKDDG